MMRVKRLILFSGWIGGVYTAQNWNLPDVGELFKEWFSYGVEGAKTIDTKQRWEDIKSCAANTSNSFKSLTNSNEAKAKRTLSEKSRWWWW